MASAIPHPYYPLHIQPKDYVPNEHGVLALVSLFGAGCSVILGLTLLAISKYAPRLKPADRIAVLWFMLTASIHLWFEGFYVVNHTRMPSSMHLFGQLWKEYSKADSRYQTSDSFVLCMESITAISWGPLSYLIVYFIMSENPYRYPVQIIVSLGQIYGDVLYYATNAFVEYYDGLSFSRPEAYYYWFYYFTLNFIWIVIPSYYLRDAVVKIAGSFKTVRQLEAVRKAN